MKISAEFFGRTFHGRKIYNNGRAQIEFYYPNCNQGIREESFLIRFYDNADIFGWDNRDILNNTPVQVVLDIYMDNDERHQVNVTVLFGQVKELLIENFLFITQHHHQGHLPHFSKIMKDFAFGYKKDFISVAGYELPYTSMQGRGDQEFFYYNLELENGIKFHLTEQGHEPLSGDRFIFTVYVDHKSVFSKMGPLKLIENAYKEHVLQKKAERKFLDFILA